MSTTKVVGACVMGTQGREPVSTKMHQYGSVIQAKAGSGEKQEAVHQEKPMERGRTLPCSQWKTTERFQSKEQHDLIDVWKRFLCLLGGEWVGRSQRKQGGQQRER